MATSNFKEWLNIHEQGFWSGVRDSIGTAGKAAWDTYKDVASKPINGRGSDANRFFNQARRRGFVGTAFRSAALGSDFETQDRTSRDPESLLKSKFYSLPEVQQAVYNKQRLTDPQAQQQMQQAIDTLWNVIKNNKDVVYFMRAIKNAQLNPDLRGEVQKYTQALYSVIDQQIAMYRGQQDKRQQQPATSQQVRIEPPQDDGNSYSLSPT